MGLFGKLLNKTQPKQQEIESVKVISLDEAVQIANKKIEQTEFEQEQRVCEHIKQAVIDVKQAILVLEKAPLAQDLNKHLYLRVKQSRSQSTVKMRQALDSIYASASSFSDLDKTNKSLKIALDKLGKGSVKHKYYLGTVFQKQMTNLSKKVNELARLAYQLNLSIKEIEKQLKPHKDIITLKENQHTLTKELDALHKEISQLTKEKQEFELKKQSIERELETIVISKELKELEEKLQRINSEIYSLIAPLSRVFRKYQKMGIFKKPTGKMIERYINEPVDTVFVDTDKELLVILENINRMLLNNELKIKDNLKKRTIDTINRIKSGELDNLLDKYGKIKSDVEKQRENSKLSLGKKNKLQLRYKEINDRLSTAESNIGINESKKQEKQNKIQENKREIDIVLRKMN